MKQIPILIGSILMNALFITHINKCLQCLFVLCIIHINHDKGSFYYQRHVGFKRKTKKYGYVNHTQME